MICNVMKAAWASAGFLRILAILEVSVRSSVTPLSPIKMVQASITKSLLQAATRTLVFL